MIWSRTIGTAGLQQFGAVRAMLVALKARMEDELILNQIGRIRRTQGVRAKAMVCFCGGEHLGYRRLKGQSQHNRNLLDVFLRQLGDLSGLQHTDGRLLAPDLCCEGGLGQPLFAAGLCNLLANLRG